MSHATLLHRMLRPVLRRLAATGLSPNHLTTLRLLSGVAAIWCLASGQFGWGGSWLLISALLDRADGELARLSGKSSRFGHYYDLSCDFAVDVGLFLAIGIGLSTGEAGRTALWLGVSAALSVALIFLLVNKSAAAAAAIQTRRAAFDPDDLLLLIAPVAWFGWLLPVLWLAGIGAPLALACLLLLGYRRPASGAASGEAEQ